MKTFEEILDIYLEEVFIEKLCNKRPKYSQILKENRISNMDQPILWLGECLHNFGKSLSNLLIAKPDNLKGFYAKLEESFTDNNIRDTIHYKIETQKMIDNINTEQFEVLYDNANIKNVVSMATSYSEAINYYTNQLEDSINNSPGFSLPGDSNNINFKREYGHYRRETIEYIDIIKKFNEKYKTNILIPNTPMELN